MKRQSGFTLVEIAIVLVIIGLLLGGVLKGQELIINAKIKRVNNDFNGIGAAVYSYFERYNAIPGDDSRAATRWTDAKAGDGNGTIAGDWDGGGTLTLAAAAESVQAWDHLRRSSLVSGGGTPAGGSITLPVSPFGGRVGIEDSVYLMPGTVVCIEGMLGKYGEIVDSQVDDGIRNAGLLRADTTVPDPDAAAGAATYTGDTAYVLCKQL